MVNMESTAELAGYFAAHAVWCVSDGSTLVPILAFEKPGGTKHMHRFVAEELQDAVSRGNEWLANNPEKASRAVLIYDGFVTLESGKTDALVLEAHLFESPLRILKMVVPYRHAESAGGFAVFRPKFLSVEGCEPVFERLAEAFFRGVDQHEKGAAVWDSHLDEGR